MFKQEYSSKVGVGARFSYRVKLMVTMVVIAVLVVAAVALSIWSLATGLIVDVNIRLAEANLTNNFKSIREYFDTTQAVLTSVIMAPPVQNIANPPLGERLPAPENLGSILAAHIRQALYAHPVTQAPRSLKIEALICQDGDGFFWQASELPLPFTDLTSGLDYLRERGDIVSPIYTPATWFGLCRQVDVSGVEQSYWLGFRLLMDNTNMKVNGLIIYSLAEKEICDLYNSASPSAIMLRRDGIVASSTQKNQINQPFEFPELTEMIIQSAEKSTVSSSARDKTSSLISTGEEEKLFSWRSFAHGDMYFVVLFENYHRLWFSEAREFMYSVIVIAVVAVIFVVGISYLLSRRLTQSLKELTRVTREIGRGNLKERYSSGGKDEFAYIGAHFNNSMDEMLRLFTVKEQDEMAKRNLEARLLQSQINPHFLYNTLDVVVWTIKKGEHKVAEQLVNLLSDFFRLALTRGRELITLKEELQIVTRYLDVVRLAGDVSIELELDVPEKLLSYPVIKLLLQPIVENTLEHGFSGFQDYGHISIVVEEIIDNSDTYLIITVRDNGIGMSEDELSKIRRALEIWPPEDDLGFFWPLQYYVALAHLLWSERRYEVKQRSRRIYGSKTDLSFD